MKIEQSAVAMTTCHVFSSECEISSESTSSFRRIFDGAAQAGELTEMAAASEEDRQRQLLLMLESMIARMLEFITGERRVTIGDLRETLPAEDSIGPATGPRTTEIVWTTETTESIREHERTDFASTGKVQTADGRTLDFKLELGMCRDYSCERKTVTVEKAVLREAVVIQMTWPGAPTLYYGDEAGQVGFTDPDNRRTYPWGQEDQELIRFYKEMIAVHRRFPVLAMGSLKFLYHDYNVLSYGRFNQEEQVIVVINNRNERVHVEIPVWLTGINRSSVAKLTQVFATDAVGFSSEEKEIEAPAGILEMDLLPLSGVVLHRCEE